MLGNTSGALSIYLLMSANVQGDVLLKSPTETGFPEQLSPCLEIFRPALADLL